MPAGNLLARFWCLQHLKKHPEKSIPLVYPMVIYHGEKIYPYSTDINDLVDAPRELVDKYFLKPFQLIDLGRINDQELKQHMWSGVMEFVMKHIFARNLFPHIQSFAETMQKVVQDGGENFISIVLQYALARGEINDKEEFFDLINTRISPKTGESVMTLGDRLRYEGKLEGKLEGMLEGELKGKLEVAERLLAAGSGLTFITEVTGIPLPQIQEFAKERGIL